MLGIGCPDRHPLPLIHSPPPPKTTDRDARNPARAGSFSCPLTALHRPVRGSARPSGNPPITFSERAIVSFIDLVGAGEDRVYGQRSGLRWRPVVDAAHRAAHQLGAVAIGQPVCNAERLYPLFIGQ